MYELLMPGDTRYSEIENYISSCRAKGFVGQIARIQTNVTTLKKDAPSLGVWKV